MKVSRRSLRLSAFPITSRWNCAANIPISSLVVLYNTMVWFLWCKEFLHHKKATTFIWSQSKKKMKINYFSPPPLRLEQIWISHWNKSLKRLQQVVKPLVISCLSCPSFRQPTYLLLAVLQLQPASQPSPLFSFGGYI